MEINAQGIVLNIYSFISVQITEIPQIYKGL